MAGNHRHSDALPRPDLALLHKQLWRHAMWLTLFCVSIGIALGFAFGAMVVESYEDQVRP